MTYISSNVIEVFEISSFFVMIEASKEKMFELEDILISVFLIDDNSFVDF